MRAQNALSNMTSLGEEKAASRPIFRDDSVFGAIEVLLSPPVRLGVEVFGKPSVAAELDTGIDHLAVDVS